MNDLKISEIASAARALVIAAFFLLAFSGYGSLGGTATIFAAATVPLMYIDRLGENFKRSGGMYLFFPLILSIGLSWYYSRIPAVSSKYATTQIMIIISVQYLALSLGAGITSILRFVAMLTLASYVAYFFVRPGSFLSSTGAYGFYNGKNALGAFVGVLLLILLYSRRPKAIDWSFVAGGVFFLMLSRSVTTMFAIAASVSAAALAPRILKKYEEVSPQAKVIFKYFLLALMASLLMALLLAMLFLDDLATWLLRNLPNHLFTGRGEIWRVVLRASSDSLLTGIGPGVFWGAGSQSEIFQATATFYNPLWLGRLTSADGGYIDLIGSIGFVGLWAMALLCLAGVVQGVRRINEPAGKLFFSLLVFGIIHNVAETSFLNGTHLVWVLFIYSAACLLAKPKIDRTD